MALNDLGNALFWLGFLVIAFGGVVAVVLARRNSPRNAGLFGGGVLGVGAVVVLAGWLITTYAVGPAAIAPPPAGGAITTTLSGGSIGSAGVTWNAASSILTVDLVYNYSTGNNFCVEASNATCGPTAGHTSAWPNYLYLPFTMARTDASNVTYGFTANVASVPTFTTVGGSTTTYSFVGYKPASGASNGQWQVKWTTGSLAGQFPSGSAPATTTNLISTLEGIRGYSSATAGLQISLSGGNSTSAPLSGTTAAFFQTTTVQQFVAYPMTVSFGSSNPSTITINYIVIGQHG